MGFERGLMAFVLVEETNIDKKGMLPQNIVSFTLVLVRGKVWCSEDTDEIIFMVKLRCYQQRHGY